MRTRDEHLAWCKQRAHEYLDTGDVKNAVMSMMSDMGKHPETKFGTEGVLAALGLHAAMSGDPDAARRYIDGFN
jgi:hypothetical protein